MKDASIAAVVAAVAALALMSYEGCLFALGVFGLSVQIASILLMIWARITFGKRSFHAAANPTEGGLVTTGPYAFVRHPIYAAAIYFTWAGALTHISLTACGLAMIASAGLAVRMIAEETLVIVTYPEYAEYMKRTKRVVPFLF